MLANTKSSNTSIMTKKYAFRGMELISDAANEDAIPDSNDEVDRLEL